MQTLEVNVKLVKRSGYITIQDKARLCELLVKAVMSQPTQTTPVPTQNLKQL